MIVIYDHSGLFLSRLPSVSKISLSWTFSLAPWTFPPNRPYFISLSRTSLSWTSLYLKQNFRSRCKYSLPISNFLLVCSVTQVSLGSFKNDVPRKCQILDPAPPYVTLSHFFHYSPYSTHVTRQIVTEFCLDQRP